MRRIFLVFMIVLANNFCAAQNGKIKLSSIVDSIFFRQENAAPGESIAKMYFFMPAGKKTNEPSVLDFDNFNSKNYQLMYGTNKKKILKKLKRVEYGYVLFAELIPKEENYVVVNIDMSTTNFDLFSKSKFRTLLKDSAWEMHYIFINGRWLLKEIKNI